MMNRYGDIDISFKRLPPVYGYHSQKLVSLEKALEPLVPQIPELPRYIKIAKLYCHFPSEHGLTHDESAAIYIYTMEWDETSLFRVLNQSLRSEDRQQLKIWFPYLKLFDTALDKLPTVKDLLWRGIPLDIGKEFSKNQLVTWWSINSCSTSVDVIRAFLQNNKHSTLFLIEATNGKRISGYTGFEHEDEVILPIGTHFRVKSNSLEYAGALNVIHLVEIDNDDNDEENVASAMNNMQMNENSSNGSNKKISSTQINSNARWKQNGITIAGEYGEGNRLNQLYRPDGISIDDDDQCIYIADSYNHRIIQWKFGDNNGHIVAGGNGKGDRLSQLNCPTDIVLDKKNDSLIICDTENRRVVRWPRRNSTKGQIIIDDIDCNGLAIDNNGSVYVSDEKTNEVKRWSIGDKTGRVVAGGNGKGDNCNQLNSPSYIFVDDDHSIYISDTKNHRVMKWTRGAKQGIVIAGGHGKGNSLSQLNRPQGLFIDHSSNVYVADNYNNRIMRWSAGSKEVSIIIGGNGDGQRPNQFDHIGGVAFDRQGNIYVADWGNNRIQRFDVDSN